VPKSGTNVRSLAAPSIRGRRPGTALKGRSRTLSWHSPSPYEYTPYAAIGSIRLGSLFLTFSDFRHPRTRRGFPHKLVIDDLEKRRAPALVLSKDFAVQEDLLQHLEVSLQELLNPKN
jgi:hypothetical protein